MDEAKRQSDQEDAGGWQYKPDSGAAPQTANVSADNAPPMDEVSGSVEWTASEFIAHDKGAGWYTLLAVAVIAVAAGLYLVTHDVFSAIVVLVMGVIIGVAGGRKPKVVTYRLDESGLTAGNKFYPYAEYKSFVLPEDGPFASIVLMPMKRFGIPVSAFLAPDSEQQVLDVISSHLPLERGQMGAIDSLMRQLRF